MIRKPALIALCVGIGASLTISTIGALRVNEVSDSQKTKDAKNAEVIAKLASAYDSVAADLKAVRAQVFANGDTPVAPAPAPTPEVVAAAGQPGPKGDTGLTGPGPTGQEVADAVSTYCAIADRCQGPSGPPGVSVQGDPGATGATGPAGAQGNTGPAGVDGASVQGPPGPAGADGAAGPAGSQGDPGASGPQGPAGNDGATGATGPQGPPPSSFTFTAGGITFLCTPTADPTAFDCQPIVP